MPYYKQARGAALCAACVLCTAPSFAAPKLLLCDWSATPNVPQKVQVEIRVDEEQNTVEYGPDRKKMNQVYISPTEFVFLFEHNTGWSINRMSGEFFYVSMPPGGKATGSKVGVCKSIEERKF